MKNIIRKVVFIMLPVMGGVCAGLLISCSSADDYTPAEPVPADNWDVYFDGNNASEYIREPEDAPVIEIKIKRGKTNGSVTVPLDTSAVVGRITVEPKSVTFAEGESEKTVTVTYAGFPEVKPSVVLAIPEKYVNPYRQKNGFSKQLVAVKKAEVVTKPFKLYDDDWSTENMFSKSESVIKWIVGENRFIYTNFFGSGIDLTFRFDTEHGGKFDKNDLTKCGGPIDPLSNAIIENESDDEGNQWGGWMLSPAAKPDADGPYATWIPEGASTGVTSYMYFYTFSGDPSDSSSYGYTAIYLYDKSYQSGYAWFSSTIIDDGDYTNFIGQIQLLDEYSK